MSHSNISIFVPHVGCPHKCAFCDQTTITGKQNLPHAENVRNTCEQALRQVNDPTETEIAFFGGSFTAIPRKYMMELLDAAKPFVGSSAFKGIRISTRPDCIDDEVLSLLRNSGVTAIELGAQSLSDKVLSANERGHTAADVFSASELIRSYGFELGLQMMVGLYMSTYEEECATMDSVCSIHPDTLRIYPTVILKNTHLAELYESGRYKTMSFDEVVGICAMFLERAENEGIRVIKCGLHASEFVERDMIGGFYHPAFRELCEGRIYLERFKKIAADKKTIRVSVPAKNISKAVGQKRCNIKFFEERGIKLVVISDKQQTEPLIVLD